MTMRPSDFGLPPKFVDFRPGQWDAITDMAASDKRFFLADIPTGGGKSPDYVTVARILEARTLVLTANKGLQHQLSNDFQIIGMEDIRGQSNYKCRAVDWGGELEGVSRQGSMCDEGPCHSGIRCNLRDMGCYYYDQQRKAAAANLVVTNYAYWLTLGRWSDPYALGEFDLLVMDEAHRAPDILSDFCAIRIDNDEVRLLLDIPVPSASDDPDIWTEWAQEALVTCSAKIEALQEEIDSAPKIRVALVPGVPRLDDRKTLTARMRRYTNLHRNLHALSKVSIWRLSPTAPSVYVPGGQTDWVIEATEHGTKFTPVWAHAYAEQYLFRGIPKVILTSATLQPIISSYLGISPDAVEYRSYDSTFDPERRPIIYIPTAKIDRHSHVGQIKRWARRIDEIIRGRMDRKGIIMPHSYDRMDEIYALSAHSDIMITHRRRGTREAVDAYRFADPPSVLVSPAINEGFDFPDDECRYIIIAKCPFADSRDKVTRARARSDKRYLDYLTSGAIVQQAGRGWRNMLDWCEVFLIDDNMRWFWPAARKKGMWPGYFVKSYTIMAAVPPPPTLDGKRIMRIVTSAPKSRIIVGRRPDV